jgi:hypothetical protein
VAARPEEIVRFTVEQNGGEYVTGVPDLLAVFRRRQLTDRARREIRDALRRQAVGTEPDLMAVQRTDRVRLFLVDHSFAAAAPTGAPPPIAAAGASLGRRLRPRTWKGWTAYGVAALFIIGALAGDSEEPGSQDGSPGADQAAPETQTRTTEGEAARKRARQAERRERQRARRAEARRRRERAQARRERARIRRARAARRERERQERLEERATPVVPEPQLEASCHPSYDPCLDPTASDYDCDGGSGDGPEYTGFVTVKGSDPYGLDNDGDGTGCE